ncbi:MAG: heavy metal translocating P-type ATPase [candidate division KSB1 bacterium]|nr:heavy metal translocating P-type ATPase [candidate division KSB1 bacterium]MDZ7365238.1 heavy metal translocating P-type ATPase [candidate division KSB1 bacterium]MDZ7403105.1 heavy metal translocating P-type ATPase [candidate division KSB1 bacterium]
MKTLHLRITGMDCADCAATLEKGVGNLRGVQSCAVNFGAARLKAEFDAAVTNETAIIDRIHALGYDVHTETPNSAGRVSLPRGGFWGFFPFLFKRTDTALAAIGGLLVGLGMTAEFAGAPNVLVKSAYWLALIIAGHPIARSGVRRLWLNREININLLMALAAIGAVVIGEEAEAATVIFLFAIGEALEGYTMDRARSSIRKLMTLAPAEATVLRPCLDCRDHLGRDGYTAGPCPFCGVHETRVPVDQLQIGETILVKPGERIPVDGIVVTGASAVNQAPITGESIPVTKTSGDEIFAGTINGQGTLEVRMLRPAAESTLSNIIHLVEEAQSQRAPAQRFIDRFARIYTPAVVVAALLVAILPPLLLGAPFWNLADGTPGWLYRALTLLVISCPCALVISTPVTIVSAISAAAKHGVLIKGGAYLEALAKVRAVAFDKTGTLTYGQPIVVELRSFACAHPAEKECESCDDVLQLAAAVERRSEHPLAQAVVAAAGERKLHHGYIAEEVEAITGRGVRGKVNGKNIVVGSHAMFDAEHPHDETICQTVDTVEKNGHTAMMVSADERLAGYIAVADKMRDTGRTAIAELRKLGIEKSVMLTGDNTTTAQTIARVVGVDDVLAQLLPNQKLEAVQSLRREYECVAMVGDGINDAPALASADVGIAMGSAGTAQAIETASVALMSDNLNKLPFAIKLSRKAMRVIKQNIAVSLVLKGVFLILALPGFATLWMAVIADTGASLIVTVNGMRLLRTKDQNSQL